ncbi:serine/threonine-protein kinase [Nannocystis bainbridge]|uniref:Tetratricopeptide repeat protein n=1 Tax=Nannocystis bainbridge TaxID=2995303 RepID=A0ABT5EEH6_9BACT|nr:serine/threonine-protein kinase [Nannocystis bainbridge]MDC0723227.1 tetratricopeptide repeat protein [Nannocystis bainbridge]
MSGSRDERSDGVPGASAPTLRLGPQQDMSTQPPRSGRKRHVREDMSKEAAMPARIGRFAIEARLGAGGMGVVYKAEDRQLGRKIAIKLLRASDDGGDGAARLLREAQALARLDHPNVVAVHEVGVLADEVFVAMEFIEGETLRKWIGRDAPRPWKEVTAAFVQAGRGLAAAHRAEMVHRDFKPENAMIDVQGRVRVLDFGLARMTGVGPPSSLVARILHAGAPGPQTSMIAGTPPYMAPEQHLGLPCDTRSDQFSFCVAFYEALFGVRPFPDGDPAHRFQAVMAGELRRPPRLAKVPMFLRAALARGLAAVPNQRHASMDALLHAITEAPRLRRRRLMVAALVLLLAVAGGLGFSLWRETVGECEGHADRVARLWAERQGPLRAAITGVAAPYADETWTTLAAAMEARAGRWSELYRAACEAYEEAAPEQQPALVGRMTCLSGQARELAAMLTALAEEPDSAARHAVKAEGQLEPVAACVEVEGLPAWLRETDVRRTMRGEEVRRWLAEIKTANEVGRYKPALARAEVVLAAARALGEPALVAEALLRIGNLQRSLADYERASAALSDAYFMALGTGALEVAAEAASALLIVDGYHRNDRVRAALWERSAAALLLRLSDRPRIAAAFHNNRAVVRAAEGRNDEAAADYRRALAIYEAEDVADNPKVALVLGNMSRVEFLRGDLAAAAEHLERSLAIREARFGKDHPEVAIGRSNLAMVLTEVGDLAQATTLLRRALATEETLYGPRHVKLAPTLDNLAKSLARQAQWVDAGQLSQRALALLAGGERVDPGAVADVRAGIGAALAWQGRFEEALVELRQALALREKDRGADHPDTDLARAELAETLLLAGEAEAAEAALPRPRPGATPVQNAAALALRGRVLLARGSPELAEPLLRRALPLLPAPLARGRARLALAQIHAARGEADAAELAGQAQADLQAAGAAFERERLAAAKLREAGGAQ